ncbi:MAG: NAD(P) transhydrogenase subunit alpha [Deltaproteobacteria bacterium]|nr:NAD(P) transhydrogenase subunit alpha [Deltaproteobacteria bacterium]
MTDRAAQRREDHRVHRPHQPHGDDLEQVLLDEPVAIAGELGNGRSAIDLENDVVRPALAAPPRARCSLRPRQGADAAGEARRAAPRRQARAAGRAAPPQARLGHRTRRLARRVGLLFLLGRYAPPEFLRHSTVFVLACFVGWQVIWSVSPSLHTPLMSVTNAISGIIIIGGMLQVGGGFDAASILGALAVLFAAINIAGGFLVTQRMLKMFRKGDSAAPASSHGGHGR